MKKSDKIKKIFNSFLDYFWPQFCLGCKTEGNLFCDHCLGQLKLLPTDYQAWLDNNNFYFDHCYVCLDYHQPVVKKLIKNFKYNYLTVLKKTLAEILTQQIKKITNQNILITNIPLHSRKKRRRGFDQTEILARIVAENLNYSYLTLLKRQKNTATQAELSKKERGINVQDAFVIDQNNQDKIIGQTIVLIDDVATTGSTLNEAAKVLRQYSPAKIIAVVLAKN